MCHKNTKDLGEVALLINESQHVHGLAGQHIQGVLVVLVVNVIPNNVFTLIFLLLQPENMPDEELLQLLICEVDAELLEAAAGR